MLNAAVRVVLFVCAVGAAVRQHRRACRPTNNNLRDSRQGSPPRQLAEPVSLKVHARGPFSVESVIKYFVLVAEEAGEKGLSYEQLCDKASLMQSNHYQAGASTRHSKRPEAASYPVFLGSASESASKKKLK